MRPILPEFWATFERQDGPGEGADSRTFRLPQVGAVLSVNRNYSIRTLEAYHLWVTESVNLRVQRFSLDAMLFRQVKALKLAQAA